MNGRVLLLCAGENARWKSPAPKQLVRVVNEEVLIARTIRQCRSRFSGEDPLLISHLACLRSYSRNAIFPKRRRYVTETLFSSSPLWGEAWTVVLLGDVFYSDSLINLIIDERDKHGYKFYGTPGEIYALSFTDFAVISSSLDFVVYYADRDKGRGKLWDLYYFTLNKDLDKSIEGRIPFKEEDDSEHFYTVHDETCDFDTIEQYSTWRRKYEHREIRA